MIFNKKDLDDFMNNYLLPPGYTIKGFCGGFKFRFVQALAIAIDPKYEGNLLLEALRQKYPEGVEAYMQEAEKIVREPA